MFKVLRFLILDNKSITRAMILSNAETSEAVPPINTFVFVAIPTTFFAG